MKARALQGATAVLVVLGVIVYASAKVHFFRRFGATDLDGYIAEHWPYTAGLAVISALIWVVVWLSERMNRRNAR